jgi:hypothetical protein
LNVPNHFSCFVACLLPGKPAARAFRVGGFLFKKAVQ